jgi:tRNA threonylcarbamoyladenosine biosynthesis protein TsaB
MMNLLAIETSGPTLSVALKKGGGRSRHATVKGFMRHAENLLPVIDRLLKKEKLRIGNIDAFLISRGPGSFTGLRIGFATLKGFLAVQAKPCYGASSLDLIAAGMRGLASLNLTICLDARRGKLFTRSYRYLRGRWCPEGPCRVPLIGEMASTPKSLIAGDGIKKIDPAGWTIVPEKLWHPKASTLIELFDTKDPLLKKLSAPRDFLPVYLRSSEPEEKLKDRK